jgi:RHS repeat-associated protein
MPVHCFRSTPIYDGDGKQVTATVNGVTTYYVGNHYEVKNGTATKYYFAGSTRLAVRTGGTLSYLLGDHIGSSSVTTDANGITVGESLYKAFGETRYTLGNLGTDYHFTGQREEAALGIYFFNARWFDPSLGRFISPDTIVPTGTQGTQAWDRYAFLRHEVASSIVLPNRTRPAVSPAVSYEDMGDW